MVETKKQNCEILQFFFASLFSELYKVKIAKELHEIKS